MYWNWFHRILSGFGVLERAVDDRLHTAYLRFVSLTVLMMSGVMLGVSLWTWDGSRTIFGPALGADFTCFYMAGTILNGDSPERLYDLELQNRLYHRLLPGAPAEERLPYVNPPFFTLLFGPLAALPYLWAYLAWLGMSVALFLASFVLTVQKTPTFTAGDRLTALLLCLSFQPLVLECWLAGQSSAFGLLCLTAALRWEQCDRPLACGLALSVCLYKPTLLVLLLPMLTVAGRWRILLGFGFGSTALLGLSLFAVGWRACVDYGLLLFHFTKASSGGSTVLPDWKYVDLVSFVRLLEGRLSPLGWTALLATAVAVLYPQAVAWRRIYASGDRTGGSPIGRRPAAVLVWSSTITWTMVLNLHLGIYDTVLVLPGLLLTADVLRSAAHPGQPPFPPAFKRLLILLYITPWFSQLLAMRLGLQLDTLVLAATATYQFLAAQRLSTWTAPPSFRTDSQP